MLVLTFSLYDSFFIDEEYFQILPIQGSDGVMLRSNTEVCYVLTPELEVAVTESCMAKQCIFLRA